MSTKDNNSGTFSAEEREAMRERARELKADKLKENGESAVLAKIEAMEGSDRDIAERLHALIKATAPALLPKTWYGMPAYATTDGKVICFFQIRAMFKARYVTLGFSDTAHLDEGNIWPVTYAITELTPTEEEKVAALVKKAVS